MFRLMRHSTPLLQTALELGGVLVERDVETTIDERVVQTLQENADVLASIGVQVDRGDTEGNPPPYYDEATGTAYWIGVFQPDEGDRDNCVTSILSLGRNPETGEMEAQLAPCVPGNWDKTYAAAEHLIEVAGRGGIEQVFDTAEGMALATDQRELWQRERVAFRSKPIPPKPSPIMRKTTGRWSYEPDNNNPRLQFYRSLVTRRKATIRGIVQTPQVG